MMTGSNQKSCAACGQNLDGVQWAPMLHNEVWVRLAEPEETLCAKCFFERVTERCIDLGLQDLRPCSFNLLGNPSWYDLFLAGEAAPPTNAEAWRRASEEKVRLELGIVFDDGEAQADR